MGRSEKGRKREKTGKQIEKGTKVRREATLLRENLRRRKVQARFRDGLDGTQGGISAADD